MQLDQEKIHGNAFLNVSTATVTTGYIEREREERKKEEKDVTRAISFIFSWLSPLQKNQYISCGFLLLTEHIYTHHP